MDPVVRFLNVTMSDNNFILYMPPGNIALSILAAHIFALWMDCELLHGCDADIK